MRPREQLTENFYRDEFACQCGCGFDDIDLELVEIDQELRDEIGEPVIVMSGCRCPLRNAVTPGAAPDSTHMLGKANDLTANDFEKLCRAALNNPRAQEGGFKIYPEKRIIHIDRGPHRRW